MINNKKFIVQDLTQNVIKVPWGVEVVCALLTPKNVQNDSLIQKIVVGALYMKPNSKKKTATIDHISDVYNQLGLKYQKGLHWIIAGDANDLKLDMILQLSNNMKQMVSNFTRLNPPQILDPIITDLGKFYHKPIILPPLDNDPDKNGKPSDHKIVKMSSISNINNKPARSKRELTFRPLPESRMKKMKEWFEVQQWENVIKVTSAHKKTEILQNTCIEALDKYLPTKTVTFTTDDTPWITPQIKTQIRRRKREYTKNRKSLKWFVLDEKIKRKIEAAKEKYYTNMIEDIKTSNEKQWYSKLKRISSYDQHLVDPIQVSSICDYTDQEQAELIADSFFKISQEYNALQSCDISVPHFSEESIPQVSQSEVKEVLEHIKTKVSTVPGDIPAFILKTFASFIFKPLTDLINESFKSGQWPDVFKIEAVTPIPKVHPPINIDDLRNISGLKNLNKVAEKIVSRMMLEDMKEYLDKSQYGNKTGVSIQHYLIKSIPNITKRHWRSMVHQNEYLKTVFPEPPLVSYKRQKNMRESLVRAKVAPERQPRILRGMKKYGKCLARSYVKEGKIVLGKSYNCKKFIWKIGRPVSCDSKNVIYMLQCDKDYCKEQYIGMTKDFRDRVYQHIGYVRNHIKSRTTGAHFNLPGHGMKNMKFTILEKVKSNDPLYARERERLLIRKSNTFLCGLNKEP